MFSILEFHPRFHCKKKMFRCLRFVATRLFFPRWLCMWCGPAPPHGASFPTWALEPCRHNLFHIAAIEVGAEDPVQGDIGPEDKLTPVVEVEGDGVLQVVEQQCVLRAVRQHLPDVDAVGEQ